MRSLKFLLRFATCLFLIQSNALAENAYISSDAKLKPVYDRAEQILKNNNPIAATKLYWNLYHADENGRGYVLQQLSRLYHQNGREQEFVRILEKKSEQLPFDYYLNRQLSSEYLHQGEINKALTKIQIAISDSKVEQQALGLAGQIYYAAKKYEDCIQYSNRALNEKRNNHLLLLRAECFVNLKNAKAAQLDLNSYLAEEPLSQKTYNLQAQIYELSADTKNAQKNFELCLAQIPNSDDCFSAYLKKFGVKNYQWSVQHFEANIDYFINSKSVLKEMSEIYSLYPRPPTERVLLKLIELDGGEYVNYKQLVDYYKKTKQPQKAYDLLQKYLVINPNSKEAQQNKESLFLIRVADQKTAIEKPVEPVKTQTESVANSSKSKAQELYEASNFEQSLIYVRSKKPRGSAEYYRVANIMYHLKNYRLARINWSYVSKNSAYYEDAKINTAIAYAMQNMNQDSLKLLQSIEFSADYKPKVEKIISLIQLNNAPGNIEQQEIYRQYNNLINLEWGAK